MSQFRVTLRPALAGRAPVLRSGVSIVALPEGALLHLVSRPTGDDVTSLVCDTAAAGLVLRSMAPGQWLAVGDKGLSQIDLKALQQSVKTRADIVDQSHGRIRILVKGPMAMRVLAKGTAVDLAVFPIGHSSTTLIGHIAAHVTRLGEEEFELIVLRGFAESLWDDLARMSLEFV